MPSYIEDNHHYMTHSRGEPRCSWGHIINGYVLVQIESTREDGYRRWVCIRHDPNVWHSFVLLCEEHTLNAGLALMTGRTPWVPFELIAPPGETPPPESDLLSAYQRYRSIYE